MTRVFSFVLIPLALFWTSCIQRAYYQSPMHGNTHAYRAMPLLRENSRSAIYAGASFLSGEANENFKDGISLFSTTIYQTQKFGNFQAFYGADLNLGRYRVTTYTPQMDMYGGATNDYLDDSLINSISGKKNFGSAGISAGINVVQPFRYGEWRILGLEYSYQSEWGDYLSFRNKLHDSAANLVDHKRNYSSLCFTTDVIGRINQGLIGYKISYGFLTRQLTLYSDGELPSKVLPTFFSSTLHMTFDKVTGYMQGTFAYYANSFRIGINYRLR